MWHPGFYHHEFPAFLLLFGFWVNSFGLSTWALFWFSPKWLPSPPTTSLDLSFIIILLWVIFLLRKIFIFTLKMEYFHFTSKATPLFLVSKNLRKFPHILWTVHHHPMQKYHVVMWPNFARENHLHSALKMHYTKEVYFSLMQWSWFFLSFITLLSKP